MEQHDNQQVQVDDKETIVKNAPKRGRFTGIINGMIGGIISAVIIVILFANNIIPMSQGDIKSSSAITSTNSTNTIPISDMLTEDDKNPTSIDEVSQAIVGIINLQQRDIWTTSEAAGSGSGIIYKKENGKAYVVTNNHVVNGAEEVEVDLNDEQRLKAKVLGTDELTDLAVLEIDGTDIEVVANLGLSSELTVGETAFAIGNPLGVEFSGSVTKGIISGLDRSIQVDTNGDNQPDWITEVIQTDAAINPGNSGGALINKDGQIVGINSMKIAQSSVEGIGFAIPIDAAIPIMEQLETDGEVARPFIGITTVPTHQVPQQYQNRIALPEDSDGGMVIADVESGSPADKAGLQQFDIITKIDGHDITTILDLRKYMYSETTIDDTVSIEIYRNGEKQNINLKLTERTI
jgi:serine protease Do